MLKKNLSTMKNRILTLLTFFVLSIICTPMFAVHKAPLKTNKESLEVDSKMTNKIEKRLEKLMAKIEKKVAKRKTKAGQSDIDFEDDTDKWMWFWIFGWAIGIALTTLAGLAFTGIVGTLFGTLGALIITFGTVSLIIWLVKEFS